MRWDVSLNHSSPRSPHGGSESPGPSSDILVWQRLLVSVALVFLEGTGPLGPLRHIPRDE